MLAERDKLNADIQDVLDKQTDAWGIKVSNVEIKRIDLDDSMIRAIARQGRSRTQPARQDHQRRRRTASGAKAA